MRWRPQCQHPALPADTHVRHCMTTYVRCSPAVSKGKHIKQPTTMSNTAVGIFAPGGAKKDCCASLVLKCVREMFAHGTCAEWQPDRQSAPASTGCPAARAAAAAAAAPPGPRRAGVAAAPSSG